LLFKVLAFFLTFQLLNKKLIMKKHLTFFMLLVTTALLITPTAQAQSLVASILKIPLNEFTDIHKRVFNNNESNTILNQSISRKGGNQNDPPDFTKGNFPLKYTKNGDALIYEYDSIYFYKTSGNFLREFATRDASGKPITIITQEWFLGRNQWVNSSKYLYSYNASGNQTVQLFQLWSDGNAAWVDYIKVDYTYDASGNMISGIYQYWDTEINALKNSQKDIMDYDASGNLLLELTQYWDDGSDDWLNFNRSNFTYNAAGKELSEVYQNWEPTTNTWINGMKVSSTYDVSENLLEYLIEYWDTGGSIWVNDFQGIYTYDAAGNEATFNTLSWDEEDSVWINGWYIVYTYDAFGNMLTDVGQLWNTETSSWSNYANFSYTWDNSNNMLSKIGQYWETGSNSWINDSKREFQYDYDNERLLATYFEWNGFWVPDDGTIIINLFENNLFWGYEVHKIEFYYSTYTSGIEDNVGKGNNAFEIYPNPAGNTVNITLNSTSLVCGSADLFDQFGKLVKEVPTGNLSSGNNTLTLDVSSLSTGFYFLKFSSGGFFQTQKLVIIK